MKLVERMRYAGVLWVSGHCEIVNMYLAEQRYRSVFGEKDL